MTKYRIYKQLPNGSWKYTGVANNTAQMHLYLARLRGNGLQAKAEKVTS